MILDIKVPSPGESITEVEIRNPNDNSSMSSFFIVESFLNYELILIFLPN